MSSNINQNINSNHSNNRLNLSSTELYTINLLNSMYINNNRLIDTLVNSNNEIRILIQNILQQNRNNNTNNTNRTNRATRQRETPEYNYVFNDQIYTTENTSFVIDYIQPAQFSRLLQSFLDPVDIYPTQEQINAATSIIRYGEIETPLNNSCPISLEPFQEDDSVAMIQYCGHIFKEEQIRSWFQTNVRCPVCRYDIRNYIPSSSSRQNNRNTATNVGTQEEPIPTSASSARSRSRSRRNSFLPSIHREISLTNLNNRLDEIVSSFLTNGFTTDASFNQYI
jgi:hypothetical protein